jgi:hypothetical protein
MKRIIIIVARRRNGVQGESQETVDSIFLEKKRFSYS